MAGAVVVSGWIKVPYAGSDDNVGSEDSDDDDDPEEMVLDYHQMDQDRTFTHSRTPKEIRLVIESWDKKHHKCRGRFPLTQIYWTVKAKMSKGWLRSAPVYSIRTSGVVSKNNMVMLFLDDCLKKASKDIRNGTKACFDAFCSHTQPHGKQDVKDLERKLKQYLTAEKERCCLVHAQSSASGKWQPQDHGVHIEKYVFKSELGATVLKAVSHPQLVASLCELLPNAFQSVLLKLKSSCLDLAQDMALNTPWEFGFREIISQKLHILGTEASLSSYDKAGYLSRIPQMEKDALFIYEVLKTDGRKYGHFFSSLRQLKMSAHFHTLKYVISGEQRWTAALDYLEVHKVVKVETFDCDKNVFLYQNWKAEVDVADGILEVMEKHKREPLRWRINFNSADDFKAMRSDQTQMKALHLMSSLPVTVLSGRGGCGKTTVVTTLLQHLCEMKRRELEETTDEESVLSQNVELGSQSDDDRDLFASSNVSRIPNTFPQTDSGQTSGYHVTKLATARDAKHKGWSSQVAGRSFVSENNDAQTTSETGKSSEVGDGSMTGRLKSDWASEPGDNSCYRAGLKKAVVCDLMKNLKQMRPEDCGEVKKFKQKILLTAPTGKAARLLGCKARLPSATLHSVIVSRQNYLQKKSTPTPDDEEAEKSWKFENVEILVVDECSLVSVCLFATILNILLRHARLRKLILLGDVRQLPSIGPGNFLQDMFSSLRNMGPQFGFSMELTQNHRSESRLIVENAGLISRRELPTFDDRQGFHFIEISNEGDDNERDQIIRELLTGCWDMKDHVQSQFVTFRNNHCKAINELCCLHYNSHSITVPSFSGRKERFDFQIGDKICLKKNNLVTNHRARLLSYAETFPELQEAFSDASRGGKSKSCPSYQPSSSSNVKMTSGAMKEPRKVMLDDSAVAELMAGEDEMFEQTLAEMRSREEEAVEERRRAEQNRGAKQLDGRERSRQGKTGHDVPTKSTDPEKKVDAMQAFGQKEEKLCNGEVFFIMDEISETDQQGGQVSRLLVLSDRDPLLPRVVCVALQELRRQCRMQHSWARTIHTYQGSESETVVYVLGPAIPQNWQHVYTAVTRGRRSVFIIGKWSQLCVAVKRKPNLRQTRLCQRLKNAVRENSSLIEFCLKEYRRSLGLIPESSPQDEDFSSNDSWVHSCPLPEEPNSQPSCSHQTAGSSSQTIREGGEDDFSSDESWVHEIQDSLEGREEEEFCTPALTATSSFLPSQNTQEEQFSGDVDDSWVHSTGEMHDESDGTFRVSAQKSQSEISTQRSETEQGVRDDVSTSPNDLERDGRPDSGTIGHDSNGEWMSSHGVGAQAFDEDGDLFDADNARLWKMNSTPHSLADDKLSDSDDDLFDKTGKSAEYLQKQCSAPGSQSFNPSVVKVNRGTVANSDDEFVGENDVDELRDENDVDVDEFKDENDVDELRDKNDVDVNELRDENDVDVDELRDENDVDEKRDKNYDDDDDIVSTPPFGHYVTKKSPGEEHGKATDSGPGADFAEMETGGMSTPPRNEGTYSPSPRRTISTTAHAAVGHRFVGTPRRRARRQSGDFETPSPPKQRRVVSTPPNPGTPFRDAFTWSVTVNSSRKRSVPSDSEDGEMGSFSVNKTEEISVTVSSGEKRSCQENSTEKISVTVDSNSGERSVPLNSGEQRSCQENNAEEMPMTVNNTEEMSVTVNETEEMSVPSNSGEQGSVPENSTEKMSVNVNIVLKRGL
ncbi:uncharacterized protein LOC101855638 [Aplysia californica]|uniref:Uncharacterized protein LOC101855638 n=1 Tax=Aplysia californica TaxID=6500 RepID=A0ABM0JME3_APLCA|nr:uncharacterized protein LOC101855638 [Aplysia californica]